VPRLELLVRLVREHEEVRPMLANQRNPVGQCVQVLLFGMLKEERRADPVQLEGLPWVARSCASTAFMPTTAAALCLSSRITSSCRLVASHASNSS
jgi:hypothetical protein